MVNLIVTEKCNQNCPYCFFERVGGKELSWENFQKFLEWCVKNDLTRVQLLGGEPFLHRDIYKIIQVLNKTGIGVDTITNGLVPIDKDLLLGLNPLSFLVNYTASSTMENREELRKNLDILSRISPSALTMAVTLYRFNQDLEDLWRLLDLYRIRALRVDLAQPSASRNNLFVPLTQYSGFKGQLVDIFKKCKRNKISLLFDCGLSCSINRIFSEGELSLFRKNVRIATRFCKPVVDIFPDLSASYCFPLQYIKIKNCLDYRYSELVGELHNGVKDYLDYDRRYQGCCIAHLENLGLKASKPLDRNDSRC
ncbi:MAG: radical SAM protein [Candidatus Aenigmarchaeota archaeon]|nr:radical SAM protein [Candidatus Aenigmarchaeota archaeon]